MKRLLYSAGLLGIGGVFWWISNTLNQEALAMAIGVLLGVFASIPLALLVLAFDLHRREEAPPAEPAFTFDGDDDDPYVPHQDRPIRQHAPLLLDYCPKHPSRGTLPGAEDGADRS